MKKMKKGIDVEILIIDIADVKLCKLKAIFQIRFRGILRNLCSIITRVNVKRKRMSIQNLYAVAALIDYAQKLCNESRKIRMKKIKSLI